MPHLPTNLHLLSRMRQAGLSTRHGVRDYNRARPTRRMDMAICCRLFFSPLAATAAVTCKSRELVAILLCAFVSGGAAAQKHVLVIGASISWDWSAPSPGRKL